MFGHHPTIYNPKVKAERFVDTFKLDTLHPQKQKQRQDTSQNKTKAFSVGPSVFARNYNQTGFQISYTGNKGLFMT